MAGSWPIAINAPGTIISLSVLSWVSSRIIFSKIFGFSFPINSFYNWDNKFVEDNEFVLLLKTVSDNYERLEKEIKDIHSYDIPAIIKINVEANNAYETWIKENTKSWGIWWTI